MPTRCSGCSGCLGYQFSPRLADIGDAQFWRIDRTADYGPLDGLARHRVDIELIAGTGILLRLAGSLKLGRIHAGAIMRVLQVNDRPTTLARALVELGCIIKTLHMLGYIDSKENRRRILTQLNRRVPASPGPARLPRRPRRDQEALPPGAGGAARRPRPDPQRHRALELDLHPGSASTNSPTKAGTSASATSPGSRRSRSSTSTSSVDTPSTCHKPSPRAPSARFATLIPNRTFSICSKWAVERQIALTPAATLAGAMVQLQWVFYMLDEVGSLSCHDLEVIAVCNALATLEQLGGRA